MRFKSLAAIAVAALALTACDDTTGTLGNSLTDNMDNMIISTDTFGIVSQSVIADSVLANSSTGYLGRVKDPETGAYITGDYMVQFHALDNFSFQNDTSYVYDDSIKVKITTAKNPSGELKADSCSLQLFYDSYFGDSLQDMKCTVYEMEKPMEEGTHYYSNFDPYAEGYVKADGIKKSRVYTLADMNLTSSERSSKNYTPNIKIWLDEPYTKNGKTYNNYGGYITAMYHKNPADFHQIYRFIHNVIPGFYIKHTGGTGSMAYLFQTHLNVNYHYTVHIDTLNSKGNSQGKDTTYTYHDIATFSGTEEVLQHTNITNSKSTMEDLVSDKSCTYLKTPAGLFTEITIPVDSIMKGHNYDSLNTAKIIFQRINNTSTSKYNLSVPKTLMIIPYDSLYSFFENEDIINYRTSFYATYVKKASSTSSTSNTYTFNNIAGLISSMYKNKATGDPNWNKAVIIPVSISTTTSSSNTTIISKVVHDMSLTSTKLVKGTSFDKTISPITINIIYSRFDKK